MRSGRRLTYWGRGNVRVCPRILSAKFWVETGFYHILLVGVDFKYYKLTFGFNFPFRDRFY